MPRNSMKPSNNKTPQQIQTTLRQQKKEKEKNLPIVSLFSLILFNNFLGLFSVPIYLLENQTLNHDTNINITTMSNIHDI
jgi:hypothetical protein